MLGRFILGITLLACCGVAYPSTAGAQETINYASPGGRVTDPQGAVVPGAEVLMDRPRRISRRKRPQMRKGVFDSHI